MDDDVQRSRDRGRCRGLRAGDSAEVGDRGGDLGGDRHPSQYSVTLKHGLGKWDLGLNVDDDDSIVDAGRSPVGAGLGNGSFTTGQTYSIDKAAPSTPIDQAADQVDPERQPDQLHGRVR